MVRGAPFHEVALPQYGEGGTTLHKFPKKVKFSKEKVCFDLEMMVFLLPYDLGVMNNYFNGVKGCSHLTK
jgi:hypothetical protein